eukprot:Rhum_TRINITY_DN14689_c34_g1::Rhum_TRINITY_DN14689_c34_g1_i1::g.109964::m.109964
MVLNRHLPVRLLQLVLRRVRVDAQRLIQVGLRRVNVFLLLVAVAARPVPEHNTLVLLVRNAQAALRPRSLLPLRLVEALLFQRLLAQRARPHVALGPRRRTHRRSQPRTVRRLDVVLRDVQLERDPLQLVLRKAVQVRLRQRPLRPRHVQHLRLAVRQQRREESVFVPLRHRLRQPEQLGELPRSRGVHRRKHLLRRQRRRARLGRASEHSLLGGLQTALACLLRVLRHRLLHLQAVLLSRCLLPAPLLRLLLRKLVRRGRQEGVLCFDARLAGARRLLPHACGEGVACLRLAAVAAVPQQRSVARRLGGGLPALLLSGHLPPTSPFDLSMKYRYC